MKGSFVLVLAALLLLAVPAIAQDFYWCADADESGNVNIGDARRMSDIFVGKYPLPNGHGDIDFRQNVTLNDARFIIEFIFYGGPLGACPPFAPYTIQNSPDSLYLPTVNVPNGSGQVTIPLILIAHQPLKALLVTSRLTTSNCMAMVDSVQFVGWNPQIKSYAANGPYLSVSLMPIFPDEYLRPGVREIARAFVSYFNSTAGSIGLDSASLSAYQFTHQLYGSANTIARPAIVSGVGSNLPRLLIEPELLDFVALAGSTDPDPKEFSINSDGAEFSWTISTPSWLEVTPAFGVSGSVVSVQPRIAGLNAGLHTGYVAVSASPAYDTPKSLRVDLHVQPQYPSLDANCDGMFNISDIVVQINYIFGGPPPCDPCGAK